MAVNEEITTERVLGLSDQLMQRRMVGAIEALDAPVYLGEAQLLRVDLLPLATMRATVPRPIRTLAEPALTKSGNVSSNIARSSSSALSADVDIGARETGR